MQKLHTIYSRMKEDIHSLKCKMTEKNRLLESFISVACVQAKHISGLQSSLLAGGSEAWTASSSLSEALCSDLSATLPWLGTINNLTSSYTDPAPKCLETLAGLPAPGMPGITCPWLRHHSSGPGLNYTPDLGVCPAEWLLGPFER